jgi:hypothetical protein
MGPRACSLIDRARAKKALGLAIAVLIIVNPRQTRKTQSYIAVLRWELLLLDRQGALQNLFRLGVAPLPADQVS